MLATEPTRAYCSEVLIGIRDLRVDYDDVCAVDGLSLEVRGGEIYGLIGPNGAGKTTTLRAVMGLLEATYGDVTINGFDVRDHREQAVASVGFMPDYSPLYEDLMVWEFLDLFAASYRIPQRGRKDTIHHFLRMFDLTEKANTLTGGLSKGMKQRLILAKTLLPDPRILLLDEPASGMDPMGRILLKNLMKRFSEQGKAVIISSHILSELSESCTSVGIMEKGQMVISGPVDEITSRVLGQARIHVELLDGTPSGGKPPDNSSNAQVETFLRVLTQNSRVGNVQMENGGFSFPFDGGSEQAADLLATLTAAGVRVISFARKRETLEDVFLKVGAKEVS